ncbi:unnamed protein product [Haemonchus placei]|uniref:DUF4476 domain-containing protein n=1 Tax=Haemonchus placei TaxID=6290 RepID=A0A0N4X4M7_HAEPC|nr:unnamed protein product [Haemonchus placei]
MEQAHQAIRECVGSTILALALETNEKPFAEFLKGREEKAQTCEEKFLSDSTDFEALQSLVYDDSRNCFQHLPRNRHGRSEVTRTCAWDGGSATLPEERQPSECLAAFRGERRRCEELLQCCPDHTRCGERMNALSIAYQHAKSKSNEIVERLLLCLGSLEPSTVLELAGMKVGRLQFRVPGLPFYKPDRIVEKRISRRLSMMSYSAIDERKSRFIKKFQKKRDAIVASRSSRNVPKSQFVSHTTSPITSEQRVAIVKNLFRNAKEDELAVYASLLAEGNFARLAELEREKSAGDGKGSEMQREMQRVRDAIKASLLSKGQKTMDFLVPAALKTARKEQSQQINEEVWILDGQAATDEGGEPKKRAVALQSLQLFGWTPTKHKKLIPNKKLSSEWSSEWSNRSVEEQPTSSEESRAPPGHFSGVLINLLKEDDIITSPHVKTTYKNMSYIRLQNQKIPLDASKAVSVTALSGKGSMTTTYMNGTSVTKAITRDEIVATSPKPPVDISSTIDCDNQTTLTVNDTLIDEIEGSASPLTDVTTEITGIPLKPLTIEADTTQDSDDEEATALLSGDEEHADTHMKKNGTDNLPKAVLEEVDVTKEGQTTKVINVGTTGSAKNDTVSEETTPKPKSEEVYERQDRDIKEAAGRTTNFWAAPLITRLPDNTGSQRIRSCVRLASCMDIVRDYENECEQRYSRGFLTHGIDDGDVLQILNHSSLSRGMLAHQTCLRSIEKSDYAMVKHLLVTQRSLRKACLEHSKDRRRMSADEILICQKPLPSTEPIDDFLFKNHYRSEENRDDCHRNLKDFKEACYSLSTCCMLTIQSCEKQLNTSQLHGRLRESVDRLVERHNECEKNVMENLKIFASSGDERQQLLLPNDFRS